MKVQVRNAELADAQDIFDLRCDPRLRGMQYPPSFFESPASIFALVDQEDIIPDCGSKISIIVVDGKFGGNITEFFWLKSNGIREVSLAWNLLPSLWGKGIMVKSMSSILDARFAASTDLQFVAFSFRTNHRSIRVIEKLGFKIETTTFWERASHFIHGRRRVVKFRLKLNDWNTDVDRCRRTMT
ncbi:GNAT family N-acetyltransferase [Stieleria sp. JC731]|uniref:GNAT family N-acetyltransferase n=1 Tax=Stieleria sp. JC731 TaxID=2894195 RepID=UPI0039657AAC